MIRLNKDQESAVEALISNLKSSDTPEDVLLSAALKLCLGRAKQRVDGDYDMFVITYVSREDVANSLGYSVDELTNSDIAEIASEMGERYVEFGSFWDDLGEISKDYLSYKSEDEGEKE